MKKLSVALLFPAVAFALSACSSTPSKVSQNASDASSVSTSSSSAAAKPAAVPEASVSEEAGKIKGKGGYLLKDITATGSILCKRSVYFSFDNAGVKPEYLDLVRAHGQLLISEPSAMVLLQGNTDERGSREYNLALGQKRAEAVKQVLESIGVKGDRVQAASLGKESPRALGHDEESWSVNRRVDILYGNEKAVPDCSNMTP